MANDAIDHGEDGIHVSEHSHSMRRAYSHCVKLFEILEQKGLTENANRNRLRSMFRQGGHNSVDALRRASNEHQRRRRESRRDFWSPSPKSVSSVAAGGGDPSNDSVSCANNNSLRTNARNPIQVERMQVRTVRGESDQKISPSQVLDFKDRFQNQNLPCLITGLDRSKHFWFANQHWRTHKHSRNGSRAESKINREWFRDELGAESLVPLRYSPRGNDGDDTGSRSSLDKDGRATECETKEVCLREWIEMLETTHQKALEEGANEPLHCLRQPHGQDNVIEEEHSSTIYYLKDWHLQQRYSSESPRESGGNHLPYNEHPFVLHRDPSCALYRVPEFFGHDLLNSFLTRFTTGDYRFCYWGPSRSFTARHSDVLHSFSWSYNVVGTKEWTFYRNDPFGDSNNSTDEDETKDSCHNNGNCQTFTIVQETGQTIFVPATWQHKVVNLEETISINHNWITSANIDLVWDCLRVEMVAIRNELEGWGVGGGDGDDEQDRLDQNMEACENMLRGCLGLDVTSFVLMTLVGLLETTTTLLIEPSDRSENSDGNENDNESDGFGIFASHRDGHLFDALRLASVLHNVLATDNTILQLRSRLEAILQSDTMAQRVETMVTNLIDWIHLET